MDLRVISIGALAAHPLRNERGQMRPGHATTTLITSGKRRILVDPGLPEKVLLPRLIERANLKPSDITDVFLTSFNPEARRGITAFDSARWLISERERESLGAGLATRLKELATHHEPDEDLKATLEQEVAILARCEAADDTIADRIDLFPMPGVTPGLCGLLIEGQRFTTLICGDAVPTVEHMEQGKVLTPANDVDQARESFQEALEIADLLVLGRDNLVVNVTKMPF